MSILVALRAPGTTIIGCDGRTSGSDGFWYSDDDRKWHRRGRWAIGTSGEDRAAMCARMALDSINGSATDAKAHAVASALRDAIREDGWERLEREGESENYDPHFLLVTPTAIWRILGNLYADEVRSLGYWACGVGEDFALGAIHAALAVGETDPRKLVRLAIDAACRFRVDCGGEVYVDEITEAVVRREAVTA